MSGRRTSLEDYTKAEREGFAKLWDHLAKQAMTDGERVRRVRIAQDWRHRPMGCCRVLWKAAPSSPNAEDNGRDKAMSEAGSAEAQSSPPLNRYVPHEWYSPSVCRRFYAIKEQSRAGTWKFILKGDDVRGYASKAARDAEIIRLEQLGLGVASESVGKA